MKSIAFVAAAVAGLSVTAAQAQAPALAPYEIVHAGDSAMACDAMAKEIAILSMQIQQAQADTQQKQLAAQQAADRGRMARGIGGAMFSQAAAFGIGRLPFGALVANPGLMNGLAQAAAIGGQAISNGGATPAQAATVSDAASAGPAQRQQYLMSLFKSKSC